MDNLKLLERPRRRRFWRPLIILGLSLVSLIAFIAFAIGSALSWRAYFLHQANERLDAITTKLDAEDPGWKWDDILQARRPVPDDQNGARHVLAAARLIPETWPTQPASTQENGTHGPNPWKRLAEVEPSEKLPPDLVKELRGELRALARALLEAHKLARTTTGRYEIAWQVDLLQTLLPYLQDTRRVADLLRYEALERIHDGDIEGAFDSAHCMMHAAASLGDEPLLLAFLIRTACGERAVLVLERAVAHGLVKPATLQRMQHELEEEAEQPIFARALRSERAAVAQYFDSAARGKVMMDTSERAQPPIPWYSRVDDWLVMRPLARLNEAAYLELTTEAIHELRKPHEQWQDVYGWYNNIINATKSGGVFEGHVAAVWAETVPRCAETDQRRAARFGSAVVAMALERYRLQHGRWPGSLEDLRPGFLKTIPEDPYVGGPLHYKRLEDGVVVYAFGRDREDNGGYMLRSNSITPHTDVGFRLWDASIRGKEAAQKPPH